MERHTLIKLLTSVSIAFIILIGIVSITRCNREGDGLSGQDSASMRERAQAALEYARAHGMNTRYAFFTDYGIPSGKPRFFVWDFKKDRVIYKTHAMHGPGQGSTDEKPVFSNRMGSNCSSLGKFEVTREHGATLKRAMRLKGLERCNSNAYDRCLMIHGAYWVDMHTRHRYIPLNDVACLGCVTLTTSGSARVRKIVMSEDDPILLWNFCGSTAQQ